MTTLSPLHDWIYVERLRVAESTGGILFPATFKAGKRGHSAREKMNATSDHFSARVLATGPEVRELAAGDEVLIWTFAEGDGTRLWTVDGFNSGERDRFFIKPDDVVCAVER